MNKRKPMSEETKRKIGESTKNRPGPWKGKTFSDEHKANLSKYQKTRKGPTGASWKGGKWPYWRREALIRDDYTCQICGLREPEIMEVDHITPRAVAPELSLDINNLITLCPNCHARKTIREFKDKLIGYKGRH